MDSYRNARVDHEWGSSKLYIGKSQQDGSTGVLYDAGGVPSSESDLLRRFSGQDTMG